MEHFTRKYKGHTFDIYLNPENKTVVAIHGPFKAKAVCGKEDKFDEKFGIKLATLRCYQKYIVAQKQSYVDFFSKAEKDFMKILTECDITKQQINRLKHPAEDTDLNLGD